jgi:uncharacterized DUF497 family protein
MVKFVCDENKRHQNIALHGLDFAAVVMEFDFLEALIEPNRREDGEGHCRPRQAHGRGTEGRRNVEARFRRAGKIQGIGQGLAQPNGGRIA